MHEKIPCSVEILTRNSARTLTRCLDSVKDFAEIIVLDGNSIDGTLGIAKAYGAKILRQCETDDREVCISNFAEVRNKGFDASTYDWFMYIDSDEYLSSEAVEEIRSVVTSPASPALVWWQPRKYVVGGVIIECASTYPNRQIRLFHKSAVKRFVKPIHEKIEVKEGVAAGMFKHYEYVPLEDLRSTREKWRRYLALEQEALRRVPRTRLVRALLRHCGVIVSYMVRNVRSRLFCRGPRMPLSYEWLRQEFNIRLLFAIIRALMRK